MTIEYLKKADLTSSSNADDVSQTVKDILNKIEAGGDEVALAYAKQFDKYQGNIELTAAETDAATALVPTKLQQDIQFAYNNVKRFAEAQKTTLQDVECEVVPGLIAGQKTIPVRTAGCYIPGGRYSHICLLYTSPSPRDS